MTTTKISFSEVLASGGSVITAECAPPHSGHKEAVIRLGEVLPAAIDAVVVADNPDGVLGSALACAAVLAGQGRQALLTMTTRDRNRIALESEALGASVLGVSGVLCVSGNHQSLGVSPQAAGVNDIDSTQLEQLISGLGLAHLAVGAVANTHLQPLELNLLRLKKKIDAGAGFLLTQPVFDVAVFSAWMDAVRLAGLDGRAAIIATVLPLCSVDQAERLEQRKTYGPLDGAVIERMAAAGNPTEEGVAMAASAAAQLKDIPGVRGIHILSSGCEELAGRVIQTAGLA